jgi:uncharacterized protein YutE (UPF0331/DUF86 family)
VVMNDILLNKRLTVERCLNRILEEFSDEAEFRNNFTKQDSVILNLQRACEACIDSANHIIRVHRLGAPQSSRDSFTLLESAGLLPADLSLSMKKMVGLRNIAVHDYQKLNLDVVVSVAKHHLTDFEQFLDAVGQIGASAG